MSLEQIQPSQIQLGPTKVLVLDCSIACKIFLEEVGSVEARNQIAEHLTNGEALVALTLLRMELYLAAFNNDNEPGLAIQALEALLAAGLELIEPSETVMSKAFGIARIGNKKQGWPSLQDSIYHALALDLGAKFWTADHRHIAKTQHLGGLELFCANVAV